MTSDSPIKTPGPFEVCADAAISAGNIAERSYDCQNYERCLGLAASLNWASFTCRGCSGHINENLFWRARVTSRRDAVARTLLQAPRVIHFSSTTTSSDTFSEASSGEAQ